MSGSFSFDYPLFLLGLAVLIPLFLYDFFSAPNKRLLHKLPPPLRKRLFASRLFFRLFLVFLIVALAGPRWGISRPAGEFRRGLDAVIALDVSLSMDIPDGFNGSDDTRLERGLSIVKDTVRAMPEIRYAAAVGKSRGLIAVPLIRDNGTVLDFLEAVDSSSVTGRGTNLEYLIDAAANAFQASHPSARVIVLVSDGESLSGSVKAAVGRCNEKGITLTAVAVGSDNGMEVPGEDGIISRRDSAALKAAAGQTGGAFIDGNRRDAAELLGAALRSLAPESEISGAAGEPGAGWLLFAVLALSALGASKIFLLCPRKSAASSGVP